MSRQQAHGSRQPTELPIPAMGTDCTVHGPPPPKRQRRVGPLPEESQIDLSNLSQPTEMNSASAESDSSSKGGESGGHEPPKQLLNSEVYIVPHPHSGRRPTIYNDDTAPPPPDVIPKTYARRAPPWHAFGSRDDFEQAEVFIRFGTSNPQINAQLALNQRRNPSLRTAMRNAEDLHRILHDLAREEGPGAQYIKSEIEVAYPKSEAPRKYIVHHKKLMPVIRDILEDEALADRIHTYPERRYVARPGGGLMRVWDELSSGEDWWEMQFKLGPLSFVIFVQLYVDATHVTSFGNIKYWALYLWVGNIPKADRNDSGGRGRAQLIGFLPTVYGLRTDKPDVLAAHRAHVYHAAYTLLFSDLKTSAEFGCCLNTNVVSLNVKGHPICMVASCDYEEMCRVAGILGPQSFFPCPICLVHTDDQWDLSVQWPKRTVEGTEKLLRRARRCKTKQDRKEVLSQQSLRFLTNTFIEVFGRQFSVFDTFVLDPLHQIEQGEWGRHWWRWLLQCLDNKELDIIDNCFKDCTRFPGVHHFRHGITELKYITGNEQGQILRYIGIYVSGRFKKEYEAKILRALRALAVIHLLTKSFKIHTEETLDDLDNHINKYDVETRKIREDDLGIDFDWPKHHSFAHASDIIRRKGPCDNYETGLGERLHPQLKRDFKRSSKRPATVTDELTQMAKERDVILKIRAEIDQYDAYLEAQEDDESDDEKRPNPPSPARVTLAARRRGLFSIGHVLASLDHIEELPKALRRLADYLRAAYGLRVKADELSSSIARQYFLLRARFVCMMSWRMQVDLIRAKLEWHGQGARHDGILINVGNDDAQEYEFGLAYAFFNLTVCARQMDLAYVRRFRTIGRHVNSDYILLKFDKVDFIPIDAIERAVHIAPPSSDSTTNYYTVQDLEPAEMYLRLEYTAR
ncbi:hypothetical protein EV715DRAFT_296107 [Schizophyllum commune]